MRQRPATADCATAAVFRTTKDPEAQEGLVSQTGSADSASTAAGSARKGSASDDSSVATNGRPRRAQAGSLGMFGAPQQHRAIEELLQRQQTRIDEAIAAMSERLPQETAADALKALDRKVTAFTSVLSSLCARVERLEGPQRQPVSELSAEIRPKSKDAQAMPETLLEVCELQQQLGTVQMQVDQLQADTQELRSFEHMCKGLLHDFSAVKGQIQNIEDQNSKVVQRVESLERLRMMPSASTGASEAEEDEKGAAAQSLELQLRELVMELRKLQQEQQQCQELQKNSATFSPKDAEARNSAAAILKDLGEERGRVAEMLDGVRQEKLEVIAMMHSFAVGKDEALQELEAARRTAREEIHVEHRMIRAPCVRQASDARNPIQDINLASGSLLPMVEANVETSLERQSSRDLEEASLEFQKAAQMASHSRSNLQVPLQPQPQTLHRCSATATCLSTYREGFDGSGHVERQPSRAAIRQQSYPAIAIPPQQGASAAALPGVVSASSTTNLIPPAQQAPSATPGWGRPPPPAESARTLPAQPAVIVATTSAAPSTAMVSPKIRTRSSAMEMRGPSPHTHSGGKHTVQRFLSERSGVSPRSPHASEHRQTSWAGGTSISYRIPAGSAGR